jgi:cysteine desulfurase
MHVNNETGIIQPVKEIGDVLSQKEILFHIDATQSAGKMIEEIRDLSYDMMSFCAHKMYGPQGVGVLILKKKRYKLPPVEAIMFGGAQERGIRPGTIPVALIAGFGKACDIAIEEANQSYEKCGIIKSEILKMLEESNLEYVINGNQDYSISNTINISLLGVSSEALMLSSKKYCGISNGSACNSNEYKPSFVLKEMNIAIEMIESSIRVSWGPHIELEILRENFIELLSIAKSLVW